MRDKTNKRLLIEELYLNAIDTVSSYHSYAPDICKFADKGNFRRAFGGLCSIGFNI